MTEHLDILERLSKRPEMVDLARSAMHGEPSTRAIAAKMLTRLGGPAALEALQWRLDRAIDDQERMIFQECVDRAKGSGWRSARKLNKLERLLLPEFVRQQLWRVGEWSVTRVLLLVLAQAQRLKQSTSPGLSRWATLWLDRHADHVHENGWSPKAGPSFDASVSGKALETLASIPIRAIGAMDPPRVCVPELIEDWPIDRLERLEPWFLAWRRRGQDEFFEPLVGRALQCEDPPRRAEIEAMIRRLYRQPLGETQSVRLVQLNVDMGSRTSELNGCAVEAVSKLSYRRRMQDSIDLLHAGCLTPDARRRVVEQLCAQPTRSRMRQLQVAMRWAAVPELQFLLDQGNPLTQAQKLWLALHASGAVNREAAMHASSWLQRKLDGPTLTRFVHRHLELLPNILVRAYRRKIESAIARRPDCLVAAVGRCLSKGEDLPEHLLKLLQSPSGRLGYDATDAVVTKLVRTRTRSEPPRANGRRIRVDPESRAATQHAADRMLAGIFNDAAAGRSPRREALLDRHIHLDVPAIRLRAIKARQDAPDAADLPLLMSSARSAHPEVRAEAVKTLTTVPGGIVQAELIASRADVDDSVRGAAERSLKRRVELGLTPENWIELTREAEAIRGWGECLGRDLLGRSEVLILNCRVGLGRTTRPLRHHAAVLEVSDTPLTSGHPYGADVVRGLILHELGHHRFDYGWPGASVARGIARSERISHAFDLLLDERLERGMRTIEPAWGVFFDRLAAYAFVEEETWVPVGELASLHRVEPGVVIDRVRSGTLPGRLMDGGPPDRPMVALRRADVLRLPGVLPPFWRWALCLRAGQPDPGDDPRVTEALARVPANLKSLDHGEVLRLAREIHRLVGCPAEEPDWSSLFQHLNAQRHLRAAVRSWLWQLQASGVVDVVVLPESGRIRRPEPSRRHRLVSTVREARRLSRRKTHEIIGEPFDGGYRWARPGERPLTTGRWPGSYNSKDHKRRVAEVAAHVPRLRRCFERLGRVETDEYASTRGNRLDVAMARRVAVNPSPRLLVWRQEHHAANIYLGVLVDRSGSMGLNKMQQAVSCAVLVTEAARGLRGIRGDVHAFDNVSFYTLGTLQHHTAATLTAGGGNNDASALQLALDQAAASRRRHRLIVVISDGQPTNCSRQELNAAISRARQQETVVMQVAVERIEDPVFPNFVDLSSDFQQTVGRMVQTIERLTRTW